MSPLSCVVQKCHINSSHYYSSCLRIPRTQSFIFHQLQNDSSQLFKLEVSYVSDSLFVAAIMSAVSHLEFLDFVSHFKIHFCTSWKLLFLFLTSAAARVIWKSNFVFSEWLTHPSLPPLVAMLSADVMKSSFFPRWVMEETVNSFRPKVFCMNFS